MLCFHRLPQEEVKHQKEDVVNVGGFLRLTALAQRVEYVKEVSFDPRRSYDDKGLEMWHGW